MRTLLAAVCASLTCLGVSGCALWQQPTAERHITQEAPHVTGTGLAIRSHNGAVRVVAAPQHPTVRIEATFIAAGTSAAEAAARAAGSTLSVERDGQRRLVIAPIFPEPRHSNDGASITVRLPGADGVTVRTSNGPITVQGATGELTLSSSNAHVEVTDHQGTVQVTTSNGGVTVTNLTGALQIDTSNAGVRLDNVAGPVDAETSNGSIRLALRSEQRGPLHLNTSNGAIHVRVGPGFAGTVNLFTSNAHVNVNDPQKRITRSSLDRNGGSLVVGEGGEKSELDTSNAAIDFTISG